METFKNMLNKAYIWVVSSTWRIATVIGLLVLFIAWLALPIWTFLKIISVLLFIGSIISFFILGKTDTDGEATTRQSVFAWSIILVFLFSIFLFFHANSYNPTVQAERKTKAELREAEEKTKKDEDKKQQQLLSDLNKWIKNDYMEKEMAWAENDPTIEYVGSNIQKTISSIDRFEIKDDNLVVYFSHAKLTGENITQELAASYAFNQAIGIYVSDNKLPSAKNVRNNELDQDTRTNPEKYSRLS